MNILLKNCYNVNNIQFKIPMYKMFLQYNIYNEARWHRYLCIARLVSLLNTALHCRQVQSVVDLTRWYLFLWLARLEEFSYTLLHIRQLYVLVFRSLAWYFLLFSKSITNCFVISRSLRRCDVFWFMKSVFFCWFIASSNRFSV